MSLIMGDSPVAKFGPYLKRSVEISVFPCLRAIAPFLFRCRLSKLGCFTVVSRLQ